jgi:ATP-dependent exoDNAse (exonuclease V) alpha subunit
MTIHMSQGQTLTKAVVDLGKGEKVAGCTFVATSR